LVDVFCSESSFYVYSQFLLGRHNAILSIFTISKKPNFGWKKKIFLKISNRRFSGLTIKKMFLKIRLDWKISNSERTALITADLVPVSFRSKSIGSQGDQIGRIFVCWAILRLLGD
jgi:hypothetical protein